MIKDITEKLFLCEDNYPFADKVNPILYQQIRSSYDIGGQSKPSNINAHFTGWDFKSKEVSNLVRWIGDLITRDFGNIQPRNLNFKCSELWGVLYKPGDYITQHNHSPSLFSFAYYVNAPTGSSPLVFTTSGKKIKPEAGKVVIFESRLNHKVPSNKCNDRCVISGNFIYESDGGVYLKHGY